MRIGLKMLAGVAVAAVLGTTAIAAGDSPIVQRKALMEGNGKDAKLLGGMAQGAVPYDVDAAAAAFGRMHAVSVKFGALFPADSKTGGKTEAAPAIWEKPAAFQAAVAKFEKDTMAAAAARPANVEAFRPVFLSVVGNCKTCHEEFRVKSQ